MYLPCLGGYRIVILGSGADGLHDAPAVDLRTPGFVSRRGGLRCALFTLRIGRSASHSSNLATGKACCGKPVWSAIENIGRLAAKEGATHVLVAGDVYDTEAPTPRTLLEPLERMRRFSDVQWHLLPGNHDPHRPRGVWDRVLESGPPSNIHLHLKPEPVDFGPGAVLLPAPLTRKSEGGDLTEWMDRVETAPGAIRIGLAHGSVVGFGSGSEATNPIDPRRPALARLEYLALGDWHRTVQIGPSIWYSGTPEPDRAGGQEAGQALVVEIPGPGATAKSRHIWSAPIDG